MPNYLRDLNVSENCISSIVQFSNVRLHFLSQMY